MDRETSYAVPQDVLVAHLEGEAVLLSMDSKRYYRLNEAAASIWRAVEQRKELRGIIQRLCDEFEVSEAEAGREAERVVTDLLGRGLLAIAPVGKPAGH